MSDCWWPPEGDIKWGFEIKSKPSRATEPDRNPCAEISIGPPQLCTLGGDQNGRVLANKNTAPEKFKPVLVTVLVDE